MHILNVIFAFIAIFAAFYYYVNRKYSYWKYHNIPYVKPTFPFGNTSPINQKFHTSEVFAKCYKETRHKNAPFIGIFLFLEPVLMASNLDFIKAVLVKDFNYFTNRGVYFNKQDDPLSAHLFNIEDQKWKELRMKLTPTFTSGKMRYMFPMVMAVANALQMCVERELNISKILNVKEMVARFTTDVIGICVFGIQCNSLKNPDTDFRVMGRQVFEVKGLDKIKFIFSLANRSLARKLGLRTLKPDVSKFFLSVIYETINYRINRNVECNDFMNLLLNIQKSNQKIDGHELTFEELAAQAFVFWAAGFETSSSVMSYALFELGYNEEIQNRSRNEIRSVLQKYAGQFSYEAMMEMKYLEQVINESLRRCPPVAHLRRIASKDYREPQTGYIIRKNQTLVIPILGIHNDPEYYPDPDVFDPDRFSDEETAKRNPFAFIPFGYGPRNCIGLRFGIMQAKIGLATLLINYKFSHTPKTRYPAKFSTETLSLTYDGELCLNVDKIA